MRPPSLDGNGHAAYMEARLLGALWGGALCISWPARGDFVAANGLPWRGMAWPDQNSVRGEVQLLAVHGPSDWPTFAGEMPALKSTAATSAASPKEWTLKSRL